MENFQVLSVENTISWDRQTHFSNYRSDSSPETFSHQVNTTSSQMKQMQF